MKFRDAAKTTFASLQTADNLQNLRVVAAIAEAGSLAGAARRLGLNHATVFRRLEAFESQLGTRLFERRAGRYTPNADGEELARAGAAIESVAVESLRRVAGHDLRLAGPVRLATTESIACELIPAFAMGCRATHPEISLQVSISNDVFDLSRRESDIAVRPTRDPPEHLVGTRIGRLAMAIYGARAYLRRRRRLPLHEHLWIALDSSVGHQESLAWLARHLPLDAVPYRTTTFTGAGRACAAGLGLAVLPCFLGDRLADVERLGDPIDECANELWLLAHPDLRHTARIRAVFDLLRTGLGAMRPLLEGRRQA